MRSIKFVILASLLGGALCAQDSNPDRVTVPFSDPSRAHRLKVGLVSGGITVKGYNGKDAIVEGRGGSGGGRERDRDRDRGRHTEGMRRIGNTSSCGLAVEEEDNVVPVSPRSPNRYTKLLIQDPVNTSLKL